MVSKTYPSIGLKNLSILWIEEVCWKSTTSSNTIGIIGTYTYTHMHVQLWNVTRGPWNGHIYRRSSTIPLTINDTDEETEE